MSTTTTTKKPAQIFLTGATGYLGGEVLHQLLSSQSQPQPPVTIHALVRTPEQAALLKSAYPSLLNPIQGTLDDSALIETESNQADIVLNLAATGHAGAARAILKGLSSRPGGGYYVQMGGASLFSLPDIRSGRFGEGREEVWDDGDGGGVAAIRDVVKGRPERVVDGLLLGDEPSDGQLAQGEAEVKTALVIGPLIYGEGRGKGNTRSIQVPNLTRYILQKGEGVVVGPGKAAWSCVHVADVGALVLALVRKALLGEGGSGDEKVKQGGWGRKEGVYCVEGGMLDFATISKLITQSAIKAGYLKSEAVRSVDKDEADQITPHGSVLLGTNARLKATRARRDLGWKPSGWSLDQEIEEVVRREARALGLQ